jgi:uncharacterized protein (DUF2235 family)
MARRLLLLFDGTSNRAVGLQSVIPTNVFKLGNVITYAGDDEQITFYFSGVGTRRDPLSMATGLGFDEILMDALVNLSSNYKRGDQLYLFGFSRGAVAAWAVSNLIAYPGLLHADGLHRFPEFWACGLGQPANPAARKRFADALEESSVKVRFLGLFDAVPGYYWDRYKLFSCSASAGNGESVRPLR